MDAVSRAMSRRKSKLVLGGRAPETATCSVVPRAAGGDGADADLADADVVGRSSRFSAIRAAVVNGALRARHRAGCTGWCADRKV